MELLPFIIFGGLIAVFIASVVFGNKAAKTRARLLGEFAASRGYQFTPERSRFFPPQMSLFPVFNTGSSRSMSNTITGNFTSRDMTVPFIAGDYTYITESGSSKNRSTSTHHRSYLLVTLPYNVKQSLSVRREGFFDKFSGMIGFEDINFESSEFSRMFHVTGSDKKFAYDLFEPRMMQWMLDQQPSSFQMKTGVLLVCEHRWKPEEFAKQIDWAKEFLERWPEHLIRTLGSAQPVAPRM